MNKVNGLNGAGRLDYFVKAEQERYLAYKKARPELDWPDVVTQVNIGLDRPFYTAVSQIQDQHAIDVLVNKYRQLAADFVPKDLAGLPLAYAKQGQQLTLAAKSAFISLAGRWPLPPDRPLAARQCPQLRLYLKIP